MKRATASVGILALAVAMSVGCGKKDKEKPKQEPKAEKPPEEPKETPPEPPPAAAIPDNTVSVVVAHEIEDWDKWKKAFDAHADARKEASAIWHSVSRDVDDENKIYIHVVATDMDKVKAFLEADDLKKVMKEAGVKGPPEIWMANDVQITSPEGKVEGETYSVFGRHEVEDFDKWKAVFDTDAEAQKTEMTVLGGSVSRMVDNENMVLLHFMITDPDKFKARIGSDDLKSKMKEGGVKAPPEITIAKDVEVSMYR